MMPHKVVDTIGKLDSPVEAVALSPDAAHVAYFGHESRVHIASLLSKAVESEEESIEDSDGSDDFEEGARDSDSDAESADAKPRRKRVKDDFFSDLL